MGEAFYWALNMSISAAISGFFVMLLRKIPIIPKRYAVLLWLFPFLRLCIPVGLGSKFSIMNTVSELFKRSISVDMGYTDGVLGGFPHSFLAMNHVVLAESYAPFTLKTRLLEKVFFVSSVIWLAGTVIGIAFLCIAYNENIKQSKNARHLKDSIYLMENIGSPYLCGIFRPRIIVPKVEVSPLIILHEKVHAKRMDNLWRLIAVFICIIHWYNPFCWLFLKLLTEDIEYACDEEVLCKIGEHRRREYALCLVDSTPVMPFAGSAFRSKKIKGRIIGILNFKNISVFSSILLTMFITAVGVVLMTNSV